MITLKVSTASDFRDNLNNNFTEMKTDADAVNTRLTSLDNSLAAVAKSGLASDITDDAEHRFINDTQIAYWNSRTYVDTTGSDTKVYQGNGTSTTISDITDDIKSILTAQYPTKTSELTNDSGFIVGACDTSAGIIYASNVILNTYTEETLESTTYIYKGDISLAGCTEDMIPTVIFNQTDVNLGHFAQVCQAGVGCVYVWSNEEVSTTIPLVYAVKPKTITAS